MISSPSIPPIPTPPAPPNPPMITTQAPNARQPGSQVNPLAGFAGTVLGTSNPTNTGQKTLLGQ